MPSEVMFGLLSITGFCDVLQDTPRAVIGEPKSSVILPPLIAVVDVIEVTSLVVRMGRFP